MSTKSKLTKDAATLFALLLFLSAALTAIAGNLEPPAAPAPTMKTLDEIEPRTAIGPETTPGDTESTFKITQSGSYYLAGNVTGESGKSGIVVDADNVSIDLNGFTLKGVPGSLDGIRPSGSTHYNLTVINGIVSNWGGSGITTYAPGFPFGISILYSRIEGIIASDNGGTGIQAAYGSLVRSCIARDNGAVGIAMSNNSGIIEQSAAISNGGDGFSVADGATMVNCNSLYNGGVGITCYNSGHTIIGCTVLNNTGGGINAASATIIKDCVFRSNTNYAIQITFNCFITGNEIVGNQGSGILGASLAGQGRSRIEGNNICANTAAGIDLSNNPGNFIYKNTLRSNSPDLNLGAGNSAPTSSDAATAGPWHNIILSP